MLDINIQMGKKHIGGKFGKGAIGMLYPVSNKRFDCKGGTE